MTSLTASTGRHLLAFVFVLSLRAHAATTTLEDRVARLEQQLARIEARLGDTASAAELAPIRTEFNELTRQHGWDGKSNLTVVKAGGKEQELSVGGYVQAQSEFGRAPDSRYAGVNNRFFLRRARLAVKGALQEHFDFTFMTDFGNTSISGVSGYRGQIVDAFLNWNKYDAFNVKIGQFKTPFGYDQLVTDTKTLMIERTLPSDLLTFGRQIGAGASGTFLGKTLTYSVGAFNGTGTNNGANDNDQFMYAGRVAVQAWSQGANKLTFATNGIWSNDTGTFTGRHTGIGLDGQLTLGAFEFDAEYLHLISNRLTGADTTAEGWYVLAGYYLIPKTLQGILRFESSNANVFVPDSTSANWVLGVNYYLKGDDLKLAFNYTLGDPAGPLSHEGRFSGRLQLIF